MDSIRQDVVDALVWLDMAHVQALLFALVKGPPTSWQGAVERLVPDLRGQADMTDPRWRDALLDELELRVAGTDDEADQETTEVPNLARFATDLRRSREAAQLGDIGDTGDVTDETELEDDGVTEERPR